ncbi:flotillin family protein [Spirulina sp. CCNP1310]|uniref:flotillin family protein n=1 Tax=Spirulina sp. CCNP1310 TaxID=3110249 RepID=UPI002B1EAF87|nr:flotillin family protein [Spirulina sp. CCNP1310]MEA5418458.1 flotillin family protein [Spirulina sp. CCNP1310]
MNVWFHLLQSLPDLATLETPQPQSSRDYLPHRQTQTEPMILAQANPSTPVGETLVNMGGTLLIGVAGLVSIIVFLLLALWTYKLFYVITPNNEAFVRTGGLFSKQKSVILNGGCIVLPGFHELTRVPLREISIDVERTGALAVRTQDYLRASMRVTFYVCINAVDQDVSMAAARLSKQGKIAEPDIKEALEKRADDAIRAAAKRKSLAEIDSDKLGFADEVLNLIQQDLKKVGLTLNNIAISEIEESDTYDENNFFDAQGVRLRTETIQRSIQQKREVELTTQVLIEEQERDAEKKTLAIVQAKEEAKLNQAQELEALRLTKNQELEALKAQKAREIQEAQDQELAKIERNKILQNQEVESARLRAQIEVAEADQESKIAQQQAAIAIVNKERERLATEAEKATAESAVVTAKAVEEAERARRLSLIQAEQSAQEKQIADQNVVEIDVFRRRRQAEIARQAAELEAESIRTLAEANRFKELAEAEGKRALIEADNALNQANITANVIQKLFPLIADQLPELARALAPQPGILGDAKIYAFPGGGNGSTMGEINQLMFSTSGLALINSLLEEGKLGELIAQVKGLLQNDAGQGPVSGATAPTEPPVSIVTPPPSTSA